MPSGIEPVGAREMGALETELHGLGVHHRDKGASVTVADVIRESVGGIVRALDQRRLDEIPDLDLFAGAEVDGRLADLCRGRTNTHDVVPARVVERDENGHQLRDARNRNTRPGSVLREHFSGCRIRDEKRSRRNRRSTGLSRRRKEERRSDRGEHPGLHER